MIYFNYLERLKQINNNSLIREDAVESTDEDGSKNAQPAFKADNSAQSAKKAREICVKKMKRLFMKDGFITQWLEYAARQNHIIKFTEIQVIEAMFALIRKGVNLIVQYLRWNFCLRNHTEKSK